MNISTISKNIHLTSKSNSDYSKKHLQEIDGKLILVAEDFYTDFKKACERLFNGVNMGLISDKKINTKFYYTFQ